MKKCILLIVLIMTILPVFSQQLESTGIIVGAGKGYVSSDLGKKIDGFPFDSKLSSLKRKGLVELGYRFRFAPRKKKFFYDIDILGSYSKTDYTCAVLTGDPMTTYVGTSGYENQLSVGIGGTFSYKIVKGLNVGLGLQPTLYIWDMSKKVFDIPVVGKIGYDFKFMELAFSYKQGLMNNYKISYFNNCRLSNWQFSIYVPLTRCKK